MPQQYQSRVEYEHKRIHAAAVYCSDGRVGEHFDDFLTHGLSLPRYDRVALPGGPACLAGYSEARLEEQGVLDELRFLIEAHGLARVVLIQHQNCAFYGTRLAVSPERMASLQRADLVRAAYFIRHQTKIEQIEGFFALIDGSTVRFEHVEID